MRSLHTQKIADEKDAFLTELLAGLPKESALVGNGAQSVRARRLHEKYLALHILAHYKPAASPLETNYFDAIVSHWIESECLFLLGFRNAGMTALRATLESAIKLVYYENHPVEWTLHAGGSHNLHSVEYRDFLVSVPNLGGLAFNSKASLDLLWKELCRFVHTDLRAITTIGVVSDIKSITELPEHEFSRITTHVHNVAKTVASCCLSVDPKWLLNVEKAYFDAVFELYTTQERAAVKSGLRIA